MLHSLRCDHLLEWRGMSVGTSLGIYKGGGVAPPSPEILLRDYIFRKKKT